ncbi:MAG: serine/threonine-protein phosphatase [Lachnospiraceae bacterium]|nr:serine/threonine-protein phosphatase [Lachnospiraceae bacterium]
MIADVSGKGMPAALFMVISKTMIKERAKQGGSPAQILMDVNNSLHAENRSKVFVSVWLGILTISTGVVVEANAGHEHPALKRGNGGFSLYVQRHGFVLGGRKGIKYREDEFTLEKGDVLFVYTDGIPEANNSNGEFFGTGRMLEALNQKKDASPKEMLDFLWEEAGIFVGEAPQFDDFTMLALKFNG